jgi:hypothetical protein
MDGAPSAARGTDVDIEEALPFARRLDWRFLLPDAELTDVAYVGAGSGTLLRALRVFTRGITVVPPGGPLAGTPPCLHDVVVVEAPSRADLHRAGALLRPGGWLYAEVARLVTGTRSERWRHPEAYAASARAAGLTGVSLHCHWRTFDSCTKIVPVHDGTAWAFLLEASASGWRARTSGAIGRRLARSGTLGWLMPCFSVVAQKPVR